MVLTRRFAEKCGLSRRIIGRYDEIKDSFFGNRLQDPS